MAFIYTGPSGGGGTGDLVGPGSSTDNAVSRFDGITGKLVQNSLVLISDLGLISGVLDPVGAQDAATKNYVDSNFGPGDVVGPASSLNNAIARYDLTTGKLLQDSLVTLGDTETMEGSNLKLRFASGRISGGSGFTQLYFSSTALALRDADLVAWDTTVDLGRASPGSNELNFRDLYFSRDLLTQTDGAGSIGFAASRRPLTVFVHTSISVGDTEVLTASSGTLKQADDAVADASAATSLSLEAGDKTAGTGAGGNLALAPGAGFGGGAKGVVDASSSLISNVLDPVGAQDAATKNYADTNFGPGDVVGPGSSTDNALARFDLATGKLLQDSSVLVDDSDNISGLGNVTSTGQHLADSGTVALPSYAFSGDPNTGIFNRFANGLSLVANGFTSFEIQSNKVTFNVFARFIPDNALDIGTSSERCRDIWVGRKIFVDNLLQIEHDGAATATFSTNLGSGAIFTLANNSELKASFFEQKEVVGSGIEARLNNTSANAAAEAWYRVISNSTAADSKITLENANSGVTWGMGLDRSDTSAFVLGTSATLGTNSALKIDAVNRNVTINSNAEVNGQMYSPTTTLTDAANISTDCDTGNVFTVTLAGARTLDAPSNLKDGARYTWIIIQDGAGSRTLNTSASVFKFPGGTNPTLSTGAGAVDVIRGVSDGTNIYCTFDLNYS